jgi:Lactonase, 7-bladed beta-propeller
VFQQFSCLQRPPSSRRRNGRCSWARIPMAGAKESTRSGLILRPGKRPAQPGRGKLESVLLGRASERTVFVCGQRKYERHGECVRDQRAADTIKLGVLARGRPVPRGGRSYREMSVRGELQQRQRSGVSGGRGRLPADFTGVKSGAGIAVHPNGKFLYASNRGHDSIAVFRIEPSKGTLAAARATLRHKGKRRGTS